MRISHVARLAAATATLAVAATALAMPAQADTPDAPVDRVQAAAARALDAHAPGAFTAADIEAEADLVDSLEALSDEVCDVNGQSVSLNSNLVLLNIVDSGRGPFSALVSSDINVDDNTASYEQTCNFALILAADDDATTFDGSYTFSALGGTPAPVVSGPVSGDVVTTSPVFTTVDEYAEARLAASGTTSTLSPAQRTVVDTVVTPRSAQAKKAAKKKYATSVKAAKKKYAKAGKTKKAKKVLTRQTAAAKRAYRKAIAPTTTRINRVESYVARTPWSINGTLDERDAL